MHSIKTLWIVLDIIVAVRMKERGEAASPLAAE
jgi:hypothetical protein